MYAGYLLSRVAALTFAGSATLSIAATGGATTDHPRGSMQGAHCISARRRNVPSARNSLGERSCHRRISIRAPTASFRDH
jgi:hypothetical protein